MATAAAGIMIGIILQTGLAIRFTSFLVDFAGGSAPASRSLITMVAAIILGTALPTTPAYIMLAALLIPALIKLGVPPMAAHMFAFYFGCLSAVTPPECLAVYAAASISRCSVWGAGWQAVKFAAAGFIVPYFFVYYPALLFQGPVERDRAARSSPARIGVVALAAGLEGYLLRTATWLERGLFLAAALLLIDPQLITDLVGLGLLAAALAAQKLRRPDPVVAAARSREPGRAGGAHPDRGRADRGDDRLRRPAALRRVESGTSSPFGAASSETSAEGSAGARRPEVEDFADRLAHGREGRIAARSQTLGLIVPGAAPRGNPLG